MVAPVQLAFALDLATTDRGAKFYQHEGISIVMSIFFLQMEEERERVVCCLHILSIFLFCRRKRCNNGGG